MPFVSGYSTEMPANDLVSGLIALYRGEITGPRGEPITTMPVTIESDSGKKKVLTLKVVPDSPPYAPLPDTSSIIHCVTADGYKVDFIVPPEDQRIEGILGAFAFVDPRAVE